MPAQTLFRHRTPNPLDPHRSLRLGIALLAGCLCAAPEAVGAQLTGYTFTLVGRANLVFRLLPDENLRENNTLEIENVGNVPVVSATVHVRFVGTYYLGGRFDDVEFPDFPNISLSVLAPRQKVTRTITLRDFSKYKDYGGAQQQFVLDWEVDVAGGPAGGTRGQQIIPVLPPLASGDLYPVVNAPNFNPVGSSFVLPIRVGNNGHADTKVDIIVEPIDDAVDPVQSNNTLTLQLRTR